MRQLVKSPSESGASLVEFAILVPVVVSIFIAFWDVEIRALTQQQHEAAMVSILGSYIEAPIKVVSDADAGEINLYSLNDTEADSYLQILTRDIRTRLNDLMVGNTHYRNRVGAELWYLTIDPSTGAATAAARKGQELYNTAVCFTAQDRTNFRNYIDAAIARVTDPDAPAPIGTKIYEITWDGVVSSPFANVKALAFVALCSDPPSIFNNNTLVTRHVLFPPKELGI